MTRGRENARKNDRANMLFEQLFFIINNFPKILFNTTTFHTKLYLMDYILYVLNEFVNKKIMLSGYILNYKNRLKFNNSRMNGILK